MSDTPKADAQPADERKGHKLAAFHAREGLHFERGVSGEVIVSLRSDGNEFFSVALTAETWSSVVAAVSASGDTASTFHAALAIHRGFGSFGDALRIAEAAFFADTEETSGEVNE